jgi:DNA-binding transcriptional MerR regulator
MPIRTMRRFAELRRGGESTVSARRVILEEHREEVLERIAELQQDLRALTEKIVRYQEMEHHDVHHHRYP